MGSIDGHRIDYNGVGVLRHTPSKDWPKYPTPLVDCLCFSLSKVLAGWVNNWIAQCRNSQKFLHLHIFLLILSFQNMIIFLWTRSWLHLGHNEWYYIIIYIIIWIHQCNTKITADGSKPSIHFVLKLTSFSLSRDNPWYEFSNSLIVFMGVCCIYLSPKDIFSVFFLQKGI